MSKRPVFITGGTGYVGQRLAAALVARGHSVRVLSRPQSIARVAAGAEPVIGDALDAASYSGALTNEDTLEHLVGTPHPSPAKAVEFRRVDLPSIQAAVSAAASAGLAHLVYVSVAHPALVMHAYIRGEERRRADDCACRLDRNRHPAVVRARSWTLVAGGVDPVVCGCASLRRQRAPRLEGSAWSQSVRWCVRS